MKNVAVFDAKTHFSSLISDVSKKKETVIITKRGQKVAKIIPFDYCKKRSVAKVINDMDSLNKEIRKHARITLKEIMEMREEGRK